MQKNMMEEHLKNPEIDSNEDLVREHIPESTPEIQAVPQAEGTQLSEQKQRKKKAFIIAAVVAAVAVIIGAVVMAITSSPTHRFKMALAEKDFATSEAIYTQNKDNAGFLGKAESIVNQYVDEQCVDYLSNKTDYNDAKNSIDSVAWCSESSTNVKEAKKNIDSVKASREAFEKAEKAAKQENYTLALDQYSLVVEADAQNYETAQKNIIKFAEMWCQSAIADADSKLANGAALEALKALKNVDEKYRNDNLKAKLDQVSEEVQTESILTAQELINNGSYRDAFDTIRAVPKELDNAELQALKATALKGLGEQAAEKANNGEYEDALLILTDDDGNSLDISFFTTIKNYRNKQREAVLTSQKGYFTVAYDSIDKEYNIVPKGLSTRYIDLGYNRNIEPWIIHDDSGASFALYLGFRQDDWIFMEDIIIDCDGKQFNLSVDYWDRITNVSLGSIAEAAAYLHVEENMLSYLSDRSAAINMRPIVAAMENAEKVMVRFKGDGYKDVTIPKSHIDQVCRLWQVYEILEESPELISVLT